MKRKRWRDLTDEEQWDAIYKGRAARAASLPSNLKEFKHMMLPGVMLMYGCGQVIQSRYDVRPDITEGLTRGMAELCSRLLPAVITRGMTWCNEVAQKAARQVSGDSRHYLAAAAIAISRLAYEGRYRANNHIGLVTIMIAEDALSDDQHDDATVWKDAATMGPIYSGRVYDVLLDTGLYPEVDVAGRMH